MCDYLPERRELRRAGERSSARLDEAFKRDKSVGRPVPVQFSASRGPASTMPSASGSCGRRAPGSSPAPEAGLVVPQVHDADLEEVRRVVEPVDVGAHRRDESRQQHRAHHRLLDAHGADDHDGGEAHVALGQTERVEGVGRHERVGDGLVEGAAGQGAPHGAPHLLRPGQAPAVACSGSVPGARS